MEEIGEDTDDTGENEDGDESEEWNSSEEEHKNQWQEKKWRKTARKVICWKWYVNFTL